MKPLSITTTKGKFMFIEVPADTSKVTELKRRAGINLWDSANRRLEVFSFDTEHFEIIGLTSSLTEDQAAMVVETVTIRFNVPVRAAGFLLVEKFRNYLHEDHYQYNCNTALDSFTTLMTANQIYTVNPHGSLVPEMYGSFPYLEWQVQVREWQSARERTSPKWVIVKVNG